MLCHICLYLKKSKVLVAGDLLEIKDGKLRPVDAMYSDNQELAKAIEKLSNYDIEEIIFSHGGLYKKNIIEALKNIVIE